MSKTINKILDAKKIKVFGHASSLAEARCHAESLLQDSPKTDITEALDYYHNTLIEEIKGAVSCQPK